MWLRDYHVDGLRLDAVHALRRPRRHAPAGGAGRRGRRRCPRTLGRPLSLIAESDLNDPRLITAAGGAAATACTAQWNDDVHHALHALLTGERQGYYGDFGSLDCLAKVLTGGVLPRRHLVQLPRPRTTAGRSTRRVPGHRFVAYLQNHDQIGNRATGDRLSADAVAPACSRSARRCCSPSPFTPMLFMGEEWGASTPVAVLHQPPGAGAGRGGADRAGGAEFAAHGWPPGDVPDPQDPATFERSHLDWSEPGSGDAERCTGR